MYKNLIISALLVTPLISLSVDPISSYASTSNWYTNKNVDLSFLKENLVPGMSKSQIKQLLGEDYEKGINHLNQHELWRYIIGEVEGYEFETPNKDEVDVNGIKNGKLKFHVAISFENDVIESVSINYLDSTGNMAEYLINDSGYLKDPSIKERTNSKFVNLGDRGDMVKTIQNKLVSKGFNLPRYGSDGVFGKETLEAVRSFQKQQRILVDGIVGPVTFKRLGISNEINNPYPGNLIKRGSLGRNVEQIQRKLDIVVDGIYGPKTEVAVRVFQKRYGLKVDGIVGENTWNVMF